MEQEDPPCAGCVAAGRQPTPPCCLSHGGQRGSGRSSQGAAVSPTELLSKQDPYLWLCESPDRTPISSGMKVFLPVLLAALLGVERGEMPPPPPPPPRAPGAAFGGALLSSWTLLQLSLPSGAQQRPGDLQARSHVTCPRWPHGPLPQQSGSLLLAGPLEASGLPLTLSPLCIWTRGLGLECDDCPINIHQGLGVADWQGPRGDTAGRPPTARDRGHLPRLPSSAACSLVCFSCTNQNSNFYCLKPTVCSDSDNYCVTVSASAGLGERRPPPLPAAQAPAPRAGPHRLVFLRRETGGLRPYPEQGLLPDLPQPQRQPRRGVHRHLLLPELPV